MINVVVNDMVNAMVNDMVITIVPTSVHMNTMILGSGRFCHIFGWRFNGIAHADSHRGEMGLVRATPTLKNLKEKGHISYTASKMVIW